MALTPGYDFDIFISYAHLDNTTLSGETLGWIEQFHTDLSIMLDRRYGKAGKIKIWWDDEKLDGSVVFNDSIADGINSSAIMICLLSPAYKGSEYCRQELELFHNKAKEESVGLKVGNRSRILNVLLNNIPFDQWPEETKGTTGFPFHNAKSKEAHGVTIAPVSSEFKVQLDDLKEAIWQLLTDFPEGEVTAALTSEARKKVEDESFTIFMGEVTDSLRTQRKRIISELTNEGYHIIEGIPPPFDAEAHQTATHRALSKAKMAVHLLNEFPGREIDGHSEVWYPQKQLSIALEMDIPQLIWMPEDANSETIEEALYKSFIENIESTLEKKKDYEFIRSSKSSLANQIKSYAEQLKTQLVHDIVKTEKLSVLLDTHFTDQLYALNLSKSLLENNIQPFINPQEDDPRKNINLLGDRMSQVRKLIFIYGNVSKEWLLERMSAALQLIITNDYPIEEFYIYMAPPTKDISEMSLNQKFLKVNIINSSKDVMTDEGILHKFLNDLKAVSS